MQYKFARKIVVNNETTLTSRDLHPLQRILQEVHRFHPSVPAALRILAGVTWKQTHQWAN